MKIKIKTVREIEATEETEGTEETEVEASGVAE